MRYPGGKGGAGVYQAIINQIPPHRLYIEPFVGGGNVFERKAPAASSILMDADLAIAELWKHRCADFSPSVTVLQGDAITFLSSFPWVGDEFVYLDPPYVHETRKGGALYACEMTDADHERLLAVLAKLPVPFALSGYRGAMYDEASSRNGWRRIDFNAMTRRGVAVESLWMNYPAPAVLAEYGVLGRDFRERERIKRKVARWVKRWQQLPATERNAIKAALVDHHQEQRGSSLVAVSGGARRVVDGDGIPSPKPASAPGAQLSMEYL